MQEEFKRYRLEKFRVLTGVLGGLGSFVGLWFWPIFILSTSGLYLLMLCGVIVRLKLKDPWRELFPAVILGLINAFLVWP